MSELKSKIHPILLYTFFSFLLFFYCLNTSFSQEYTSSDFKLLDPVMTEGGGFSSSIDYKLDSAIGQVGAGTSSATSYKLDPDFLFFPTVTTPIISTSAGNGQISISWTAANGSLGWTASGYNIGISTVSGGPYTFTSSLGNVLSSTRTGLSNGTIYYFVVRVEDAFGNIIATSTEISSTPSGSVVTPSSGGGGGGGNVFTVVATANFSGKAYPNSVVTLLKDGQIISTANADINGNFTLTFNGFSAGNYIFGLYAEDKNGNRSSLTNFPLNASYGTITNINGVFLPPTIAVNKSEVKKGDKINIFGQSVPNSDITISIQSSSTEFFFKTKTDKEGLYSYMLDTSSLKNGLNSVRSKILIDGRFVSGYSNLLNFKVSNQNILITPIKKCFVRGDLNNDCLVNLVDFSIASFWYGKQLSNPFKAIELLKLNGDGIISITDFSIMAYYWTR